MTSLKMRAIFLHVCDDMSKARASIGTISPSHSDHRWRQALRRSSPGDFGSRSALGRHATVAEAHSLDT